MTDPKHSPAARPPFCGGPAALQVGRNDPFPQHGSHYRGRNVIERRYCDLKQWRGLATRYDKHALTYRAALVLNAVLAWTRRLSDMP